VTGATAQYSGNISAARWKHLSGSEQTYYYNYDSYSRLTAGIHGGGNSEQSIGYDLNGNINALTSTRAQAAGLSYTYSGNRLTSLTKDGTGYSYSYDSNGNTTTDGLRGMSISYNYLNLPSTVTKGSDVLAYIYDAAGNKLAEKINSTVNNFYTGAVVYKSDKTVDYIPTGAGLIRKVGSDFIRQYNINDHMGNVRAVVNQNGTIEQATDYYPFGMAFSTNNLTKNNYLYNGKELQNQTLSSTFFGMYDYGARYYDPVIGRWGSPDPLAEKWRRMSPYNYAANNPIRFIDPDGMEMTDFKDKNGSLIQHIEDGSNAVFKLTGDTRSKEYFEFTGYDKKQGGENTVNVESAIKGAQNYTLENYTSVINTETNKATTTYCNYGTINIAKTYESAIEATGRTADIRDIKGSARTIGDNLSKSEVVKPTTNLAEAQKAAKEGSLVIGYWPGHVFTLNKQGSVNNVGAPRAKNNVFDPKHTEKMGQKFYIIQVK